MADYGRTLSLLLLLCGLGTAPLGSMEQAPAGGTVAVTLPHAGGVPGFGTAPPRARGYGGVVGVQSGPPAALYGPRHDIRGGAISAEPHHHIPVRTGTPPRRLTYQANAPPRMP